MSKNSCSTTCQVLTYVLSFCIIIASIVIGSIGAALYVKEKHAESIYKLTMCFVDNYTSVESQCARQVCQSAGFNTQCTTTYYTCYIDTYTVIYNASDGTQLQSITTAENGPGSNSVRICEKSFK